MGKEKGLVELAGKPLIEHAVEILEPIAGKIMISSNTLSFDYLGFPVITDIVPDSGPMGGIYSCLKKSNTDVNLILSCDTPFVTGAFLDEILDLSPDYQLVAPWYEKEYFEPLCAYYNKDLLPVFREFIQLSNYKIPDLFRVVNFKAYDLKQSRHYHENMFMNINSRDDLVKAETFLSFKQK